MSHTVAMIQKSIIKRNIIGYEVFDADIVWKIIQRIQYSFHQPVHLPEVSFFSKLELIVNSRCVLVLSLICTVFTPVWQLIK